MDSHKHITFFSHGNYSFKEIFKIFPEFFFVNRAVFVEKLFQVFLFVAAVPTGKRKFTCEGIHFCKLVFVINQRIGTVGKFSVKFCTCPVKNGHEVIADTFYACFCKSADIFVVVRNKLIP